jgi:hypothetical protein
MRRTTATRRSARRATKKGHRHEQQIVALVEPGGSARAVHVKSATKAAVRDFTSRGYLIANSWAMIPPIDSPIKTAVSTLSSWKTRPTPWTKILDPIAARGWGRRSAVARQVYPDDAVRFGKLFSLLLPEFTCCRKSVDEDQWKALAGNAYKTVANYNVLRRNQSGRMFFLRHCLSPFCALVPVLKGEISSADRAEIHPFVVGVLHRPSRCPRVVGGFLMMPCAKWSMTIASKLSSRALRNVGTLGDSLRQ